MAPRSLPARSLPPRDAPLIDPSHGLRQRRRVDGTWRVWWEPTAAEARLGARAVDLSTRKPGDAQREAIRLRDHWAGVATGQPRRRAGSVDDVIQDYQRSRHWAKLRETTRASYLVDLRAVSARWGAEAAAALTTAEIDRWYEALLADKGRFRARALLRMLSIVLTHAQRLDLVQANRCQPVSTLAPPRRSRRGTAEELAALIAATRRLRLRSVRAALMLVLFGGGQRQIDVLSARPQDLSRVRLQLAGMVAPRPFLVWHLVRSKRGNAGTLVINPQAAPVLRLQMRLAATRGLPLIHDEATGQPYSKRLFFARWCAVRAEAARSVPSVATLQWRDLRRTFSTLARAGGASVDDVADAIGNTAARDDGLRETYMPAQMETSARATLAVRLPDAAPATRARRA